MKTVLEQLYMEEQLGSGRDVTAFSRYTGARHATISHSTITKGDVLRAAIYITIWITIKCLAGAAHGHIDSFDSADVIQRRSQHYIH